MRKPHAGLAAAVLTAMLLGNTGQAVADDDREDGYWSDWRALASGYIARRREAGENTDKKPKASTPESSSQAQAASEAQAPAQRTLFAAGTTSAVSAAATSTTKINAALLKTEAATLQAIPVDAIATALGKSVNSVRKKALNGGLHITTGPENANGRANRQVAWYYDPATQSVIFPAAENVTFYTTQNAFRAKLGRTGSGTPMPVQAGAGPASSGADTPFEEYLVLEEEPAEMYYHTWVEKDNPDADYWYWDILARFYVDSFDAELLVPAPTASGTATLWIYLRGASDMLPDADDHTVYIYLNDPAGAGAPLAVATFDALDEEIVEVDIDQSLLDPNGNNTLTFVLDDSGSHYSSQLFERVEVAYTRQPEAEDNSLWLDAAAGGNQRVTGLEGDSADDIYVVEDPLGAAIKREDILVEGDAASGFDVSFEAIAGLDYLVASRPHLPEPSAGPDHNSRLSKTSNNGAYLIIAHRDFTGAAEALASYRAGLGAKIAYMDDIYDEFSAGRRDPWAVTRFVNRARSAWNTPPQTIVLLGKGTLDEKDRLLEGDSYVPILMASNPWSLVASDARLLGLDASDAVSVGRIPITTNQQGLDYVAKVQQYETLLAEANPELYQAVSVADNPDDGGNFHANSAELVDQLAWLGFTGVEELLHFNADNPAPTVREQFVTSDTWRKGYVSYDGHGSTTQLGDNSSYKDPLTRERIYIERFLTAQDAEALTNGQPPAGAGDPAYPVFMALTCSAGNFAQPGTGPGSRSVVSSMVLNPTGGAIAGLAGTGLSLDPDANTLSQEFIDALYDGAGSTVGEAARDAKWLTSGQVPPYIERMYTVIGEPAVYAR